MAESILYDQYNRPFRVGPQPLPPPQPKGHADGPPVELVPLQNVDIISGSQFARFQPDFTGGAMIRFNVNTAGVSGVLSLTEETIGGTQVNTTNEVLDGQTISSGILKKIPIQVGHSEKNPRVYSLSFSGGVCNVTVQVIGPVEVTAETDSVQVVGNPAFTLSGRITQQVTLQNAAAATGQGTVATMAVPFSVDFTVEGANSPVFTITPQMYDNAGNGPFTCPVYQTDTTPGLPVYTISATGHSYHAELPGGWSFYVNLTALTTGSGITVTVPATVEAN